MRFWLRGAEVLLTHPIHALTPEMQLCPAAALIRGEHPGRALYTRSARGKNRCDESVRRAGSRFGRFTYIAGLRLLGREALSLSISPAPTLQIARRPSHIIRHLGALWRVPLEMLGQRRRSHFLPGFSRATGCALVASAPLAVKIQHERDHIHPQTAHARKAGGVSSTSLGQDLSGLKIAIGLHPRRQPASFKHNAPLHRWPR